MPGAWNDAASNQGREYRSRRWRYCRRRASQRIRCAIQKDRRRRDLRALRELPFHLLKPLFARRISIPMTIGVNHHVHEIGIVERGRGWIILFVAEMPAGRPRLPQQLAEAATIRREPGSPALGIEI